VKDDRRLIDHPMTGCLWPILLKKSASVSTAEKFAPEIEICALGRRFTTRISRSSTQEGCFYPSVFERFGQTDFFNTIGQKRTLVAAWFRDKADVLDKTRNTIKPLMEFKFPEDVSRS